MNSDTDTYSDSDSMSTNITDYIQNVPTYDIEDHDTLDDYDDNYEHKYDNLWKNMMEYIKHNEHVIVRSVENFNNFISDFVKASNAEKDLVIKILFHMACSYNKNIAKFMLENKLCTESIAGSFFGGCFPLERVISSYENYELIEYFSLCGLDLNNLLSFQSPNTQRTLLFETHLPKKFLNSDHCTNKLLTIPDYQGNNFFHYVVLHEDVDEVKHLLKSVKITRDIILQPNNKGSNAFSHAILYSSDITELIIKSGKMHDSDFDVTNVDGKPVYFTIFDSTNHNTLIDTFLNSPYCTEERVKKYLKYNNSKSLKKKLNSYGKFKLLVQNLSSKKFANKMLDLDNKILQAEIEKLKLENQLLRIKQVL